MDITNRTVLVIEDEENILEVVRAYLEKEGFKVFTTLNGEKALKTFENEKIDFIILDLMLPDLSGEEICKRIRLKSKVPILMLTAKAEEENKIQGLNMGADDYLTKPFSPKELVARIRAILRRTEETNVIADLIEYNDGDLIIDTIKMEVLKNGQMLKLTPTEFKILSIFSNNPRKVFTREELIEKVFGFDYDGYDRTIDTHVKNLRQKIEDEKNKYITTIYGVGYKFMGD